MAITEDDILDMADRMDCVMAQRGAPHRAARRAKHRHDIGAVQRGCRCHQCFCLRAAGCETVNAAIACDGTRALARIAATLRTCKQCHKLLLSLPLRKRVTTRQDDALFAQIAYTKSCCWCQMLMDDYLGQGG
jgi:hypothetical protein